MYDAQAEIAAAAGDAVTLAGAAAALCDVAERYPSPGLAAAAALAGAHVALLTGDSDARHREYLVAELTRAVGLGGRARTVGGTSERARTSVTRSLRYALRKLSDAHGDLGAHLDRTVRTGTY